jgi:3-oxoacyl-[acyl-carrier-protein] synthase III
MREVAILDIRQQCTGFIYGLSIADNFIRSGTYRHILVVGSEIHSTGLDVSTNGRDVAVLFGDGAGAVVVGPSEDPDHRILSTHLHADGSEAEILWVDKPGSMYHPMITAADVEAGKQFPKMVGKKVFKHAVTRMPQAIMEGMIANQLKLEDIDLVIPHQANLRINEMVGKMIGLPPEKMHNNIQKVGNTTAASIPLCMKDAVAAGKLEPGDLLCLVGFGAGLTWGSVFLRY